MTSIMLKVTGAQAWASVNGPLTSGMVGIPVTIEYDASWDGLTKNLVCRCSEWGCDSGEHRAILNVENTAVVAHEVMKAGMYLHLGIEGFSHDGELVMPTTWAMCGEIQNGANTGADLSADPTLPIWNQLQAEVEQIKENTFTQEEADEIRACAQSAAQAAASAERSKANAVAASNLAASDANAAEEAAETALVSMENARTSAASAANLANEALRRQREAEAAAERAEAAAESVRKLTPVAKTGDMIQPVGVDEDGLLWTAPTTDHAGGGNGSGQGVTDYNGLSNKPRINGVELSGDKTAADFGIGEPTEEQVAAAVSDYLTEHPIDGSGLYDGAVQYNHMSGIAYVGEPTDEEIGGDSGETYVNLFDKDTMIGIGWVYRGSVNASDANANSRHATVPIEGGKTYAYHRDNLTVSFVPAVNGIKVSGMGDLCFYDASGAYLYGILNVNGYLTFKGPEFTGYTGDATFRIDNSDKGISFTTEENVAFVKFNIFQNGQTTPSDENTVMLEEGDTCHEYVPFGAGGGDSDAPDISGQTNLKGCEITELFGAGLQDRYARQNIARLQQKVDDFAGSASFDDTLIDRGVRKFGYRVEPAQGDIPDVYITGDAFSEMNSTKNEVKMAFNYFSKTRVFGGWLKIKWQGNLSLSFPKHNFTVKLYGDKAAKRKLKVDLGGWGEQNKFVWKANYIDRSHARNIVSARLWADMVASRATSDKRMMYAPNHGAIDGFPFRLFVNGEYYGLMTWNIPKDGWMTEMTEDDPNHCLMCAELNGADNSPCDFAKNWSAEAWEVEFPDEMRTAQIYSFNDIISCVVNDSDEDFKANIDNHLDIASAIDYYIFFYLNAGIDSLAKNMLLLTYDGVKWYCGAYDMDAVWGRNFEGLGPISAETKCPEGYANTDSRLWPRIETCFGQELRDRYFDLRETVLSKEYIMAKFRQFVSQIPDEVYAEDAGKNSGMRGVYGEEFLEEISTWLDGRFAYVDAEMEAMVSAAE